MIINTGGSGIPESFEKGELFQKYIRDFIFTKRHYVIVDKTHSYLENLGDFIESTVNPDYKFRDISTNKEFFIEAKFRTNITYNDKVEICSPDQLSRYQSYAAHLPLFILLGLGGTPLTPKLLSLLPISAIQYPDLYFSKFYKFQIKLNAPLIPQTLWTVV
jgi:hypothetical protein